MATIELFSRWPPTGWNIHRGRSIVGRPNFSFLRSFENRYHFPWTVGKVFFFCFRLSRLGWKSGERISRYRMPWKNRKEEQEGKEGEGEQEERKRIKEKRKRRRRHAAEERRERGGRGGAWYEDVGERQLDIVGGVAVGRPRATAPPSSSCRRLSA